MIKHIIAAALLLPAFIGVGAQDAMPAPSAVAAPMEMSDSLELHTALLNEGFLIPSDQLYPTWENSGVHYTATLPDSLRIDLRKFVMPTTNTKITDVFGYRPRRRRAHNGLDIKVQRGDTIRAAFDGKVRITAYQRRGYGHYVVIRHGNGLETVYAHLQRKLVTEDQNVKAGDPIGLGGNSGRSTGPHLHFETVLMGKSLNPALFFDFPNQKTTGEFYTYYKPGTRHYDAKSGKMVVEGPEPKYHKVRRGETVSTIARKHGVSQRTIFKLNGINARTILRVGQRLRYQ
ncbi:MAG: peptidoglycan DD-metalloendopeptidase family protein [Bacteroidaceae bacterium]|nr:peptidoglycan DD-metalloendopeptidase family protein [Bacteroidaceae bacterium]